MTIKEGYEVVPIGYVRNIAKKVEDVPPEGISSTIVICEEFSDALLGLMAGMYIHVLTIFHLADGNVQQGSRGTDNASGAFIIRSSCRPNRIGMTTTKILNIDRNKIELEWLDFSDGTPVIDIKRYNWRWECVLSNPHDNRLHIERQLDEKILSIAYKRPAVNYCGRDGFWISSVAQGFAKLVKQFDVFPTGSTALALVEGPVELLEAVQGIMGMSLGCNRLTYQIIAEKRGKVLLTIDETTYAIDINPQQDETKSVSVSALG